MTDEKQIELAKRYLNVTFTEDFDGADLYCYTESTRDGYDVYVVTHDMNNISINEDVFYYDSELASSLMEEIESYGGFIKVHIDSYLADDIYLDDQFLEYFVEHAEEIIKDFEDELSEEEVKEFKVEHGLIEEDEA
jgi:hypothetical protein